MAGLVGGRYSGAYKAARIIAIDWHNSEFLHHGPDLCVAEAAAKPSRGSGHSKERHHRRRGLHQRRESCGKLKQRVTKVILFRVIQST